MTTPEFGSVPEPGLYPNMSEHLYRSLQAWNQSCIKAMERSPMHCHHERYVGRESEAFDFGNAAHSLVLQPHLFDEMFAIRPPGIDRRTKAGKIAFAQWEAESGDKIRLEKAEHRDQLLGIQHAVLEHELLMRLLSAPGENEVSFVWDDAATGIRCKGRADRILRWENGTIVLDLKTCKDASERAVSASVASYGYDLQSMFYLDGLNAVEPGERMFVMAFVEKTPPHGIALWTPDLLWQERGRGLYQRYLRDVATCEKNDSWPGYPSRIQVLEAPVWVAKQLENG